MNDCPFKGDNKHCEECAYYPEFQWNDLVKDCCRNMEDSCISY